MDTAAGLWASLHAEGRCRWTGGRYVCAGHFDYYGSYMVWTYHSHHTVLYKVIPYDHPAPEVIEVSRCPS